jgi:hypothetical protein
MQSLAGAMSADHPPAPGKESALPKYREEMETESKRLSEKRDHREGGPRLTRPRATHSS